MNEKDALKYGEYIGQITQSMYDKYARPDKLTSTTVRGSIPFQTYSYEMWKYVRRISGKGGGIPLTKAQRIKQATSLVTGTYLYSRFYANKMMNRELGTVGSVIPLMGSLVDEGVDEAKTFTKKQLGMEYESRGYQGAGRSPIAPAEELKKLWKASETFIEDGESEPLINELIFWGSGASGVGGGVQMNRVIDTLSAFNKGEITTKSGNKVADLETTPWEVAKGMYGGKYNTSAGRKYIEEEIRGSTDPKVGADWNLKKYPEVRDKFKSVDYSPSSPSTKLRGQELDEDTYKEYSQKMWDGFLSASKSLMESEYYQNASQKQRKDILSLLRRRVTEKVLDGMGIEKK